MHSLWTEFGNALRQPEYLHVLINPIPVYGLITAIAAFVVAWAVRSRSSQALALGLIIVTAAAAGPAAHFGHQSYDRVYSLSNQPAEKWLNWHEHLGDRIVWIYYAAAAAAILALASLLRRSRFQRLMFGLTLALALAAFAGGAFLAFVGGKIRHSEFRDHPPPPWANTSGEYN